MSTQLTNVLDEVVARKKADALKKELLKPVAERRKPEEVINSVMDDWLFTTATGTQLDPSNLTKVFYALLTKAELRRIRFHDARHTYATLLIQQGESLAYVKDQLRHSSIQITVDIYGHLVPGGNRQAVDKLDDVAPDQPPVEAEKEATPEEFGNKFGNISEEEQEEASQVVDIMARPEGFEPPTLRSEERLRHRLTKTHVEKKSETQAINAVSDLWHGLQFPPSLSQSGSNLVAKTDRAKLDYPQILYLSAEKFSFAFRHLRLRATTLLPKINQKERKSKWGE